MNNCTYIAKTYRTKRQIEVKWCKSNDSIIPKIMDFLRIYFHPNEPLNRSIDLMSNEQDCKTLDAQYLSYIAHNASVVALDPNNGSIVGALLNIVNTRDGHEGEIIYDNWNPSPLYRKSIDLWTTIEGEVDLFAKYPHANKILDHAVVSVSNDWQGDGITQILVNYSKKCIAKELNCELCFAICTSLFSAKSFARCGYREIWRKKFCDYKNGDTVLFPTEPPHDYIICKLFDLNEFKNNENTCNKQ